MQVFLRFTGVFVKRFFFACQDGHALAENGRWWQGERILEMSNYYALFYDQLADDFVARRAPFRDEHLRLARESHGRGEIQLAGALADPADGALLVFRADDAAVAEDFAKNDPYVKNGLVKKWQVRKWSVVVGNR